MEIWIDKHAFTQHVLQLQNLPLESLLENEMQKLGANQRLKSGIFCVLECGICTGRIRNPALWIWNPQRWKKMMKRWWTNEKLMRIKEWNMKTWIWEYCLFWHQIIGAKIVRNIWSTVKRIDLFILGVKCLSVYTLTIVCIFSTFFSIHFLWYCQGEFVWPSRAS